VFGVDDPGLRVVQDRALRRVEGEAGPAFGGGGRRKQLGGDGVRGQKAVHVLGTVGPGARAVVEAAGDVQQFLFRLVLELPPQPPRAAGQPHVERIRVRPPEDPRAPVRAAAPVPRLERLDDHDRAAAAGQRPGGRAAREPGPDDDGVRAFLAHGAHGQR
jgi:hypothetical protein